MGLSVFALIFTLHRRACFLVFGAKQQTENIHYEIGLNRMANALFSILESK